MLLTAEAGQAMAMVAAAFDVVVRVQALEETDRHGSED